MEGAHAGDTTWTKVERKAKGKKVFLGRHDQDKSKKVYVDKSSNYVAKGEPAMKGINVVESSLHISKGNQVLKQARNFKLASSGFTSAQGPLLAIGDFNEILLSSEVKGGNFVSRRAERFGALLDECGLIDLGAHVSLYTWFRHMQGNWFISKRLDRAVATDAWCFRFPERYVENLARMHSDYYPIMIRCQDCASAFELVTSWQVPLWHLEKEVIQLIFDLKLRRDWDIRFELIPREANVVADRLAKMGSGGSGANEVHLWHQPPEVVCPLLLLRT
ncbi:hypothetical protein AHAS_Ahas12G0054300 [Arachis hypogaea]